MKCVLLLRICWLAGAAFEIRGRWHPAFPRLTSVSDLFTQRLQTLCHTTPLRSALHLDERLIISVYEALMYTVQATLLLDFGFASEELEKHDKLY